MSTYYLYVLHIQVSRIEEDITRETTFLIQAYISKYCSAIASCICRQTWVSQLAENQWVKLAIGSEIRGDMGPGSERTNETMRRHTIFYWIESPYTYAEKMVHYITIIRYILIYIYTHTQHTFTMKKNCPLYITILVTIRVAFLAERRFPENVLPSKKTKKHNIQQKIRVR